jgi:hypothetical protein
MAVITLAAAPNFMFSQLKPLDAMLSDYKYPYEVHFFSLKSQNNDLKMAYMDVHPAKSNGKTIMLLHGKISMVLIGREPQKIYLLKDSE